MWCCNKTLAVRQPHIFLAAVLCCLLLSFTSAATEKPFSIQLKDLPQDVEENVLAHLSAAVVEKEKRMVSESMAAKLTASAEAEVAAALQAFGFYSPTIKLELDRSASRWRLDLDVEPGAQTRYRHINISVQGEGQVNSELLDIVRSLAPVSGQAVMHQQYTGFKASLTKRALELGFLDGQFSTHTLSVTPEEQVADVNLIFETGAQYYFGQVNFDQSMLKESLAEKFVKPKKGEPFESSRLIETQLRLSESEYFESVFVDIHRDQEQDGFIPVSILAAPRKAGSYKLSLGYGTDTGPRAGVSADIRRVNRGGHKFLNQLEVSEVDSTLASQYRIPMGDVRSEFVDFSVNFSQQNINALDTREYRLATSLNQDRWGGRRKMSLELLRENWSFDGQPSDSAILFMPALEFSFKSADDPFFAARGYSYAIKAMGAAENVLSDHSFARVDAFARAVYTTGDRTRLLLRGELGAIATDDFDSLPPSIRYFAGGSQSVRGYGYNDLSPVDGLGNEIGGKYLAAASMEFDYLVYRSFGLAVFADAGNASEKFFDDIRYGAGVGLRYKSPAGMFRLDVAHPFNDPDKAVRLHLSFGIDL